MMHDIFGPFSGRHRVLVDVIAKRLNALVVLPDCFDGQGGVKVRYYFEIHFRSQNYFKESAVEQILCFHLILIWSSFVSILGI